MVLVAELVSISLSDKVPRELAKWALPSPPGPSPALLLRSLSAPRVSPELLLTWKGKKGNKGYSPAKGSQKCPAVGALYCHQKQNKTKNKQSTALQRCVREPLVVPSLRDEKPWVKSQGLIPHTQTYAR